MNPNPDSFPLPKQPHENLYPLGKQEGSAPVIDLQEHVEQKKFDEELETYIKKAHEFFAKKYIDDKNYFLFNQEREKYYNEVIDLANIYKNSTHGGEKDIQKTSIITVLNKIKSLDKLSY